MQSSRSFWLSNVIVLLISVPAFSQTDMFWSATPFKRGAVNSNFSIDAQIADRFSLYLYWDHANTGLEIVNSLSIELFTSAAGIIEFIGGEVFNFDVVLASQPDVVVSERFGDAAGLGKISDNGQRITLIASALKNGDGIRTVNAGPKFLDLGYDATANAFIYGRVDFKAVGPFFTDVLGQGLMGGGIVADGELYDASFGFLSIGVPGPPHTAPGDVNHDGVVSLLDVNPFVALIISSGFQVEADINGDCSVNFLDVAPFIDILLSQ